MNLFLIGIIIFVIVYLFLNWFARTSSKKIATTIKKIAVYFSLILAMLLAIGGKYIFSLPFSICNFKWIKNKRFYSFTNVSAMEINSIFKKFW